MSTARAERPAPSRPRPYHFPRFGRTRLSNGMSMISAALTKLPLISVVAVIDAGARRDPERFDGLATLTARLLLEGTTQREGTALAEAFEQLGASVDASAGWDSAVIRLTVLRGQVEAAIALMSEVVRDPGFRDRDVARAKSERLAEILQLQADPRSLADESFAHHLYAPDARYARRAGGGTNSVERITPANVRAFYQASYAPTRTTLIVVGDLEPAHAITLAENAFRGWHGAAGDENRVLDEIQPQKRRIIVVPKSEASQSELRVGHRGVPRMHPDYFPLVVMNAVLGGLFSSRINLNLRERHGFTYGAHSGFDWRSGAGPFMVSTAVETGVTASAAMEIVAEIERIRSEAIAGDELNLAKSYLAGVFPIRYETTAAISDALGALATYGYPDDYFDTYRAKISAVTSDDVLRVARDHLDPDALLILAVGDAGAIEGPLGESGLGTIDVDRSEERDVDG